MKNISNKFRRKALTHFFFGFWKSWREKLFRCGKCSASVQFGFMYPPFHYTYQLDNLLEGFEL